MTVLVGTMCCRCTPPSLTRMPSASSTETPRCKARALALGTLPLDPSQAVRLGREIEARSSSSCCERPVRLRAARNMPPVISTIVMLRLFAQRQRASMSAYFTNSLTPPTGFGLLASPRGGDHLGRAARGPVALRKMACRSAARAGTVIAVQGRRLAHRGGAAWSLPLQIGEMDAKTRDLALLTFMSLFCAISAWAGDRAVFGSAFFALGAFAVLGAAYRRRR